MIEIRFHGRGGQGAVTAGELMVNAANYEGKWAQSFPFFSGERRGAPVMAFLRIDDRRIWLHQQIYEPDCCVVLDQGLVLSIPWMEGLKQNGFAVLNWSGNIEELILPNGLSKIGLVDAVDVSQKAFGKRAFPITNTTMLGALSKTSGLVQLESLRKAIIEKWSGKIAESNIKAIEEAYKVTEVYEF
jgi:pyruvate ferredoxin oxidoreductase gamma subunit/2-oxoisovalerate ferredoxin oxidoreductase gamma subunit